MGAWHVLLNGVLLSGGEDPNLHGDGSGFGDGPFGEGPFGGGCLDAVEFAGCLNLPPAGLGLPGLRTEDVTYPQRDGVRHFADWYEPRIVNLTATVCPEGCPTCPSARAKVRQILQAWDRHCEDAELVIFTDCHGQGESGEIVWTDSAVVAWDFEDGTTQGWTNHVESTVTVDSTRAHSGTYSMHVTGPDPGIAADSVNLQGTISAGAYVLRGWAYVPASSSQNAQLRIGGTGTTTVTASSPTRDEWTLIEVPFTYNGTGTLFAYTWTDTAAGGTGHWYDDLGIWEATAPYPPEATVVVDRALVGPFGIKGRPRGAEVEWATSDVGCADLKLRFDGVDHRMYVLDECGTPGSGAQTCTLEPSVTTQCRTYERCYDDGETGDRWCYDQGEATPGNTCTANVAGTLCSCATLTLHGRLTNPTITNQTTGETITYNGTIGANSAPVIIDGENGTATQGGASRTHLLAGSPTFCLEPGENDLVLASFGQGDTGYVEVTWRDQVQAA